jgi:hypothetical protein
MNKFLSRIISSNNRVLFGAKQKIVEVAKKQAQEVFSTLPNPSDLSNQLNSLNISKPEDLQKAEILYQKIDKNFEAVFNKLNNNLRELQAIKTQLTSITDKFNTLAEYASLVSNFVQIARLLLPLIDTSLAAQNPATGINGLSLKKSLDKSRELKEKITLYLDAIDSISNLVLIFDKELEKLLPPLEIGIEALTLSKDQIQTIRDNLKTAYLEFLSKFNFPTLEEELSDSGQSVGNYLETNIDNLSTIFNNNSDSNTFFIEKQNQGKIVGYEYKKIKN